MRAIDWIFHHLPDTDDPEVRKRVVYTIMGLCLTMFFALVLSISYVAKVYEFEVQLCRSQNDERASAVRRTDVIRRYLVSHQAGAVASQLSPPRLIDCHTGREIK